MFIKQFFCSGEVYIPRITIATMGLYYIPEAMYSELDDVCTVVSMHVYSNAFAVT